MTHTPNRNYEQGYREARAVLCPPNYASAHALRTRLARLERDASAASDKGDFARADFLLGKAAAYRRRLRCGRV